MCKVSGLICGISWPPNISQCGTGDLGASLGVVPTILMGQKVFMVDNVGKGLELGSKKSS